MEEIEYVVTRSIDDTKFSATYVENRRKEIRKRLIDEGVNNPPSAKIERMVQQELEEVAKNMMLEAQGHNDLHRDIGIGSAEKQ